MRGIDIAMETEEVVALLGANGAGKSTTLKAIVGLVPASGEIRFAGSALRGLPTERIVVRGITLVPEGRRVFPSLTVRENSDPRRFGSGRSKALARNRAEVFELFPRPAERRHHPAGTLSGGQQQQLAIARALMSEPRLILLDEPSLGLAPQIVDGIFELIQRLKQRGQTILLVEQNVAAALDIADRAYVMANGVITMSGAAEALRASPQVAHAYLGGELAPEPAP